MTERCPSCKRPKLWVHGAERCCNPHCPGDPQTQLLQEDSGGVHAARGEGRTGIPTAPDYTLRTSGLTGSVPGEGGRSFRQSTPHPERGAISLSDEFWLEGCGLFGPKGGAPTANVGLLASLRNWAPASGGAR